MEESLTFRDGHRVTKIAEGVDEHGPYLRLRHLLPTPKRRAGAHWHPVLTERWTVRRGRMKFRIDGSDIVAGEGDSVSAPARVVHEFWSAAPDTILDHEIRPPLRHWEMFRLWQALDVAGRTTRSGIPRNPFELALLWERQDGYLAGVPAWAQRLLFGGLAALARRLGYESRWRAA
ncbi:cupin domain-containing protein [Nocardia arthritidis]|uniref:Cupin domain-containing protein n=1 Tax=Nocardia arthritidis TaxID=228602 RepID=A0A6G9YAA7_9NOCA|nr:cupin domain-containing protein [Nocardia arthritidis]QIS09996.1 cupin domain-containing protein [Nocardia arthritidis]